MNVLSNKPKILVTGATGKTGHALVNELLSSGWPVRALVRKQSERSERLARQGAEIAVADLFDSQQLLQAMNGISRAYYCPPLDPFAIQSAVAFAEASREARLEAIVGLSQWLASPNHPSLHTRQLWQIERLFASIPGVAYVKLNPGYFLDNYLRLIDFATLLSVYPILTGESRNAPPSSEDIGRVAAALLKDPGRYAGQSFRPTGPRLVSAMDLANLIRKVIGGPLLTLNLPHWMFARAARLQGVPAFQIQSLLYYFEDHKQGAFEFGAPSDVVQRLTSRPPEEYETVIARYAAAPFAKRTLRNRLRAFLNFNLVPFTPGYSFGRMEREGSYPSRQSTLFAMEDASWKSSRELGSPQESPGRISKVARMS